MRRNMFSFIKKKQLLITGTTLLLSAVTAGLLLAAKPSIAAAATCTPQDQFPETNILYCGLNGSSAAAAISSFQNQYNNNTDNNGHTDIQTAYNDTGASHALVNGMNTSNTMLGTAYGDTKDAKAGTVVVNGRTVATDIWIGARWTQNTSSYKHIEGDVYTRSYKTYFLPNTTQVSVLVHFDSKGQADFIVMRPCGNMITFTPVQPPVKKLTCSLLSPNETGSTSTTASYSFTAQATATNTTPSSFTFDFGDSSSKQTINTTALTASSDVHTYALQTISRTITITAVVNNGNVSGNCSTTIKLQPLPEQSLTCTQLTQSLQSGTTDTYTFTATANANNTTISNYLFLFGDGSSQSINTTATTAVSQAHKYTPGDYTATVTVTGPIGTAPQVDTCKVPIHVSSAPTSTTATTNLPNAGAGNIVGIVGATSVIGGLGYHFFIRRKAMMRIN